MEEKTPQPDETNQEIGDIEFLPFDYDPVIRAEIDRRSPGGRALSYLVTEWRDAIMAAAEHPGIAEYSERTATTMNAVVDMLDLLGIQRSPMPPPPQE